MQPILLGPLCQHLGTQAGRQGASRGGLGSGGEEGLILEGLQRQRRDRDRGAVSRGAQAGWGKRPAA